MQTRLRGCKECSQESESDSEKGWDATDASSSSSLGSPPGNAARAETFETAGKGTRETTLKVRQTRTGSSAVFRHTFARGARGSVEGIFAFTDTFHVDLAGLPEFAAVFALGYRTTFFLDFEKGTVGVSAGGGAVTFDASFTAEYVLAHVIAS